MLQEINNVGIMTKKEFQKIDDAARRIVSKKYGWRQNSYFNWKVEDGYIFTLFCYHHGEASLEVKPLYFDDLWWEITGTFRYEKKPPMSLRCNGCAAICAQKIAEYNAVADETDSYVAEDLEKIWDGVFKKAETYVLQFLKENPDANTFFPDESKVRAFDNDRLDYIMALLHNNRNEEAIAIITEAKSKGHKCYLRYQNGEDGYDAILAWCKKRKETNDNCSSDIPNDNCSSNIAAPNNSLFKKIGDKLGKIFKK